MKKLFIFICIFILIGSMALAQTPATPTELHILESEAALAPTIEPVPEPEPPTVHIWKECPPVVPIGYIITMYSEVQHTEGWIIEYQWERGKNGVFEDIPGANEPTYSFAASIESVSYLYRLTIYYRLPD